MLNMGDAILTVGNFTCTISEVTMECGEKAIKKYKEFNAQMNEVHKLVKESYHVQCPCELLPFEEMVDTDFVIPITKNDTPASIAEAIIKSLERRY